MKKICCCFTLVLFVAFAQNASAQSSRKNDSHKQPKWLPAGNAEYYFLPEIDTYYYVAGKQFIYQSGGYWTFSSYLPASQKQYDLNAANKIGINEPGAYRYFAEHKAKYGGSSSNASVQKDQPVIGNKQTVSTEKKSG